MVHFGIEPYSQRISKISDGHRVDIEIFVISGFPHLDVGKYKLTKVCFGDQISTVFPKNEHEIVYKKQNCCYKLKVEKNTFRTVPVRASNSQWSSRTVHFKFRFAILILAMPGIQRLPSQEMWVLEDVV